MKILVSGKNSQLGEEFFKITKNSKNIYEFTDSKTLNFNNVQSVEDVIKSIYEYFYFYRPYLQKLYKQSLSEFSIFL